MKNLKRMLTAASLTAVIVCGALSANAESSNNDSKANAAKSECTVKSSGFLRLLAGVIITQLTGITIVDPPPVCAETDRQPTVNRVRWS